MNLSNVLKNIEDKDNFMLAIDFVLKKISAGIRVYSSKDMQSLGKIVTLISKSNQLIHNDNQKMSHLNRSLVQAFSLAIKDSTTADELKDVLVFYPVTIIDEIVEIYPQSKILVKLSNFLKLNDNIKGEFDHFLAMYKYQLNANKEIRAEVDKAKLDKEMKVADDLNDEIASIGTNSLSNQLAKLMEKKSELADEMDEITVKLGPFISSDYSKEDIHKWISELSDEGLLALDSDEMDEAVELVQKYSKLNKIDVQENEVIDDADYLEEATKKQVIDTHKEENRITKVVETNISMTKGEFIDDTTVVKEAVVLENIEKDAQEVVEEDKEAIVKPLNQEIEHYNQEGAVSKLKDKHKKGMSI